jgi:hypothetical protein
MVTGVGRNSIFVADDGLSGTVNGFLLKRELIYKFNAVAIVWGGRCNVEQKRRGQSEIQVTGNWLGTRSVIFF